MEAGLRWINADRKSRACHVGQVIGRCVNFSRLHPDELVWFSNAESYVLDDELIRDAIYEANWLVPLHAPAISLYFLSAKLHYTDTGYGRVVQHHQRTSSQQVIRSRPWRYINLFAYLLTYRCCTGVKCCVDAETVLC